MYMRVDIFVNIFNTQLEIWRNDMVIWSDDHLTTRIISNQFYEIYWQASMCNIVISVWNFINMEICIINICCSYIVNMFCYCLCLLLSHMIVYVVSILQIIFNQHLYSLNNCPKLEFIIEEYFLNFKIQWTLL